LEKTNIILTGLPGSGKSTIGVILAKELCMDFIDTDVIIQTAEKMTLQDIIDKLGLDTFLAIEEKSILGLDVKKTVIAPGGSVIFSEKAVKYMKRNGVFFFLDMPLEIITPRIDIYTRGIVKQPEETLGDVKKKRDPLYRTYADYIIECGTKNQLEIMKEIADLYNKRGQIL
jgi:shikimate kinase